MFDGSLGGELLQRFESMSLGEFLSDYGGEGAKDAVGDFTSLSPFWDKSVGVFLREEVVNTADHLTTIAGGMSELPLRLAARVLDMGVHFRMSTAVKAIRVDAQGAVDVACREPDGSLDKKRYDTVLCTIPFPVLRRMTLEGFSQPKLQAIAGISYTSAYKQAIHCSERFWETQYGIYAGASVSDQLQRQVYYPMDRAEIEYHQDHPLERHGRGSMFTGRAVRTSVSKPTTSGPAGPGVLLVYNWGSEATRFASLPDDVQYDTALSKIERFHPEVRQYADAHKSMAWADHEWSSGAFSLWRPAELTRFWDGAISPEGRCFFAGEHCSTDNGWIQGSLISALRSVLDIVSL